MIDLTPFSLPRHYPASSVLRTSPQPQTAQSGSHELPVGLEPPIPLLGFPVFLMLSYACRRHYPGRNDRLCSLVLFHRYQLCPKTQRVSFCIVRFEACSTFTLITTYMLTEPLKRPFTSKAPTALLPPPPLRLLPGGANQFPGGSISH